MSSLYRNPAQIKTRTVAYSNFMGLDSSRPLVSQDTGQNQTLAEINNAFCDFRGQIQLDRPASFLFGDNVVVHTAFFAPGETAAAEYRGAGIYLTSSRGHTTTEAVFSTFSPVSSTLFNGKVFFFSKGFAPQSYDGSVFQPGLAPSMQERGPAFGAVVQRRLCVAGVPGFETRVFISRVDNENVFPDEEQADSENVLRAGYIDIANLLGTADQITGLGTFEQDRLAIFTSDRTFIFKVDPDINQWALDDRANIHIGCIGHNAIANAGTDLLFCSRTGVHSIKRSVDNGILVSAITLSDMVKETYRQLTTSVSSTALVSSVWDRDEAQLHIFFPDRIGSTISRRLTVTVPTAADQPARFSTADFLNQRCGAFLAGKLVVGTSGGVYELLPEYSVTGQSPTAVIETPTLWHGRLDDNKQTSSFILQAAGQGDVTVQAFNEDGRQLQEMTIKLDASEDDGTFLDVPLSKQYERKFEHIYRGVRFRFLLTGKGIVRITGFAVRVRS